MLELKAGWNGPLLGGNWTQRWQRWWIFMSHSISTLSLRTRIKSCSKACTFIAQHFYLQCDPPRLGISPAARFKFEHFTCINILLRSVYHPFVFCLRNLFFYFRWLIFSLLFSFYSISCPFPLWYSLCLVPHFLLNFLRTKFLSISPSFSLPQCFII